MEDERPHASKARKEVIVRGVKISILAEKRQKWLKNAKLPWEKLFLSGNYGKNRA